MNDITQFITHVKRNSKKYKIILLCNVEGLTYTNEDYLENSLEGDYYSLSQFQKIRDSISKLGYEVISFFHELDFIRYILTSESDYSKLLVISTAKTGVYLGRKSLIPSFCELNKIKYLGCDPYTVSFAKDKYHWHLLLEKTSIPITKFWYYKFNYGWINNNRPKPDLKVICKLNSESCGIGLSSKNILFYNNSSDTFINDLSNKFKQSIIIEEFISGYEAEVPVIILKDYELAFEPCLVKINGSVMINEAILDYQIRKNDIYNYVPMSEYNTVLSQLLKQEAIKAAKVLNLQGLCRIDFRINKNYQFYVTDVATTPFFDPTSSISVGFKSLGFSYDDFIALLIYSIFDKSFPII